MLVQALSLSFLLLYFLTICLLTHPSNSAVDSFIYGGCSQLKYSPGTLYELNVNSVLSSLVNSATLANYNNFKISLPGSTQNDVVYGLFQCRGDISSPDCRDCVAHAVSRLGTVCAGSTGGATQLDGCFVKYDNISFLGVQDKSVVTKKCGPSIGYDSDLMNRRDALMGYLTGEGQYFRVGGSGEVQGVAQCMQDLSVGECRDCLGEATGQLKSLCGSASWGDMFLGKCYVRYSDRGAHSISDHDSDYDDDDDDEMQKTLAILIGVIAGVALVIVFLFCLTKLCENKGGK